MTSYAAHQRASRKYLATHRDEINEKHRLARAIARDGRLNKEERRALGRPLRMDKVSRTDSGSRTELFYGQLIVKDTETNG